MDRFTECGTQTDAVVVLSLAQAAVLGLVSENELLGATVSPAGFFPGLGGELPEAAGVEPEEPEGEYRLEGDGQAPGDGQEEEALEAESSLEKHARRRKRPPVRLVPKVKREKAEVEEEVVYEVSVPGEDKDELQHKLPPAFPDPSQEKTVQSSAVKMIDLSSFSRKPRRLRHLRRHTRQSTESYEPRHSEPDPAGTAEGSTAGTPQAECAFEAGAPSPGEVEAPASPEQVKSEQGFSWQEPGELEADAAGANSERNKKAQLDRLDINVQIDDSYLVEAGDRQKRWQCRMCEKSYTSKYNLVTHILGHNGIKPHSCPHCNKLFKQPSHLQTHLLTHQGTRPHKCEVCSKAFTQTSHLKRHMLLHTDIKPYSCRFCGRGFAYPSELKAHEVKHESGRCHVCVECGLDFSTLTQLKRHLATHQGPTLYQCLECSKSFHYRSQLQNHMLKHQNVRPFVCTECGMEFSQIHHLKQHSLTHKEALLGIPPCAPAGSVQPELPQQSPARAASPRAHPVLQPLQGVKEFKCEVCGREFTLQANMKRHMLIHTSVRPYQCHICFKTFVQKQTLKTHMIVHSPVKPFKCKVCGKSFNRMYNLLGHMHLHAGSKPFKCPYCSSKFNLKGNLSRHMKVKHGVMDISLDSQDPMMDLAGAEHAELDGQQEMEDFEEENSYGYGGVGNPPDESALTEQAMKEMAYYNML
ncbi:zinc finger protein 710 isoform X1 [Oxyura jamaicensis]|uniref:zinc finger protein 710 isoform X1 n=1 Tax=Oxyura jamaicensis TaxID=8884 RepID=UPI0015A54B9F|nr:zinc finger protein 710 isoform X1 [Oxyura jamaicensis]XP_035168077.1 zinc finger protein 710 isoform X1 [Oxyura jamaicensis]XP_035168078.1 zinc finger protein 710 isoform X1 [Oxyura jamaicensis]XP_035168079.1 zinc finger protein 710 isoform X1 [Oxyura jamaicensis]XP_035168080.1 zinc finger protein 710 isoform X1 [Oxyura jamaicensis]XP_035168081.1 zinc finger protein 710 isoform X1 [Oxyura jamaicensis]